MGVQASCSERCSYLNHHQADILPLRRGSWRSSMVTSRVQLPCAGEAQMYIEVI